MSRARFNYKIKGDERVERDLAHLVIPMFLVAEWGEIASQRLLDAIRKTCETQFNRSLVWRMGPDDRNYRLFVYKSNLGDKT